MCTCMYAAAAIQACLSPVYGLLCGWLCTCALAHGLPFPKAICLTHAHMRSYPAPPAWFLCFPSTSPSNKPMNHPTSLLSSLPVLLFVYDDIVGTNDLFELTLTHSLTPVSCHVAHNDCLARTLHAYHGQTPTHPHCCTDDMGVPCCQSSAPV
jgi:hypothetical protein